MTPCPDDNLLIRMAHGGVSGEALAQLETHLDACTSCRTLVAAVAAGSAEADPRAPVQVLSPGHVLGRYTVERLIGSGGMGVLYLARDTKLDRRVALKLMRPHYADEIGRARLLREAQAMARLSHPNVVNVFDLGEVEDRVFVAMEFVEGGTLRDWLRTPRTVEQIRSLFLQAGAGLLAAHRAGIVHRDFKPENVLLGADGRARVTDFGLARPGEFLEQPIKQFATGPVDLTQTGTVLGTPAYMSPEQLQLQPADARSDQYSFCVSLYEALEGQRPFGGDTLAEVRTRVLAGSPTRPSREGVPAPLWRTLERGMSVQPAGRFASMEDLLRALEEKSPRSRQPLYAGGVLALAGLAVLIDWMTAEAPVPAMSPPPAALPSMLGGPAPVALPSMLGGPAPVALPSMLGGPPRGQGESPPPEPGVLPSLLGGLAPVTPPEPAVKVEEVNEPVIAEPLPADGVELDVEPSQNRTFDVTGATKVFIADPRVADVAVDQTELTLGGLELGKTTLSVTLRGRTHVFPVRVRTAVQMQPQRFTMLTGTERELNLPGLTRITMGDASVVDVRTDGNGQFHFTAGMTGTANVFVWTRDARRFEYVVDVTGLPAPEEGPLRLVVGLQQVLDFPGVTHASLNDPTVCEVKRLGDHELLLLPQKPGMAILQVWMGAKGATRVLFVRAAP